MKILYISNNDGTDTRIKKELKSLAKGYSIIFIGNGLKNDNTNEVFGLEIDGIFNKSINSLVAFQ